MHPPLTSFVNDLLVTAGMTSLPDDFRQQYVAKLVRQLEERIGLKALAELDEEQLADYERMMQPPKPAAEVLAFFEVHIHDFPQKLQAVLDEFGAEFVAHAQRVRQELKTTSA